MSVREVREALGLTRQALATLAGVAVGAVWSVEQGKGTRDAAAAIKVADALRIASAPPDPDDLAKIYRLMQPARAEWVVSTEWNGLKPGQRFTVVEVEGSFSFIRHVTANKGAWVDGFGGRAGYGSVRSFHESRVRVL